jgi:putative transposase
LDEIFVKINGVLHYLWRTVYQDDYEIDILMQKIKNKGASIRFFKLLLKGQGVILLNIVTDKLVSYSAVKKELIPSVDHLTVQYENNGCELSHHQPTDNRKGKCGLASLRRNPL